MKKCKNAVLMKKQMYTLQENNHNAIINLYKYEISHLCCVCGSIFLARNSYLQDNFNLLYDFLEVLFNG